MLPGFSADEGDWCIPALRVLVAPAIVGAVALEALKVLGAYVVPHYVASSSELYGALGVVFALLLWLLVFGRVVVYVAVIEAFRAQRSGIRLTAAGAP